MSKTVSDARINPKILKTEIGIRELEEIKIYPLSLAGQGEMADIVTEALSQFNGAVSPSPHPAAKIAKTGKGKPVQPASPPPPASQMSDMSIIAFIVDLIKKNLSKVLTLATDFDSPEKADEALKKIDNDQAVEIAEIVWTQNYENSLKNGIALFRKVMSVYQTQMHPDLEGADPGQMEAAEVAAGTPSP